MAFNDGVKSIPIAYVGLVSVLLTIALVMALQVVYFKTRGELNAAFQNDSRPPAELSTLTSQQLSDLTKREVVDREKKIVTIGISRAMDLVVQELADGQSTSDVIGPSLFPPLPESGDTSKEGEQKPAASETPVASKKNEPKPKEMREKKDADKS